MSWYQPSRLQTLTYALVNTWTINNCKNYGCNKKSVGIMGSLDTCHEGSSRYVLYHHTDVSNFNCGCLSWLYVQYTAGMFVECYSWCYWTFCLMPTDSREKSPKTLCQGLQATHLSQLSPKGLGRRKRGLSETSDLVYIYHRNWR